MGKQTIFFIKHKGQVVAVLDTLNGEDFHSCKTDSNLVLKLDDIKASEPATEEEYSDLLGLIYMVMDDSLILVDQSLYDEYTQ